LTLAELTAMKPEASGEYVFLRDAYGKLASFLFGWMQMLIAKPGSQAALGMGFAIGLNDFLDKRLEQTLVHTSFLGLNVEITTLQIVAVMAIVIFTTLNCASVSVSGGVATVLTAVKIALILFVTLGAFVWATGDFAHFSLASSGAACEGVPDSLSVGHASYSFMGGFAAAMLAALWGYDGWDNLTFVAGEVKDPKRNIPLAIIGSTILVIVLYVVVNISYFYVLDPTSIASISTGSSVAKVVVSMFFGGGIKLATGVAVAIFTFGLMMSSLGSLHTSILAGGRVPYAMAQDGLMFKPFGRLAVTHVPVTSLIVLGLWACILALSGSFDTLTDYVIFGSWIFYALVTSSIFIFRRRYPDIERPYKAWGYPVVPVIFLLVAIWLLVVTVVTSPKQSGIGLFLIALGLPIFWYLNRYGAPLEPVNDVDER
jgi:APA family basic amino acid/polyamine antiporter